MKTRKQNLICILISFFLIFTITAGAEEPDPNCTIVFSGPSSDDTDGVELTFGREYDYETDDGIVKAIDINGTGLFFSESPVNPTVFLSLKELNVLAISDITGTDPPLQQVIVKTPNSLITGNYNLRLTNTKGSSSLSLFLNKTDSGEPLDDGSSWVKVSPLATWFGRRYHSSVVFNEKMWIFGGVKLNDDFPSSMSEVWSSTDGAIWVETELYNPFRVRHGHTSAIFNSKMWVIGGADANDVWSSLDGIDWTQIAPYPPWANRMYHSSVVFKDKVWVMGGFTGAEYKNDVWYSADGSHWTRVLENAPWEVRGNHTSLVFDNKIWVIAGQHAFIGKKDVWSSPDGINWTQVTSNAAFGKTKWHTSVVYDNKMWVLGGESYKVNNVWSSTNGKDWVQTTDPSLTEGFTKTGHSSVVFDEKMWMIGGFSIGTFNNEVWHSVDSE